MLRFIEDSRRCALGVAVSSPVSPDEPVAAADTKAAARGPGEDSDGVRAEDGEEEWHFGGSAEDDHEIIFRVRKGCRRRLQGVFWESGDEGGAVRDENKEPLQIVPATEMPRKAEAALGLLAFINNSRLARQSAEGRRDGPCNVMAAGWAAPAAKELLYTTPRRNLRRPRSTSVTPSPPGQAPASPSRFLDGPKLPGNAVGSRQPPQTKVPDLVSRLQDAAAACAVPGPARFRGAAAAGTSPEGGHRASTGDGTARAVLCDTPGEPQRQPRGAAEHGTLSPSLAQPGPEPVARGRLEAEATAQHVGSPPRHQQHRQDPPPASAADAAASMSRDRLVRSRAFVGTSSMSTQQGRPQKCPGGRLDAGAPQPMAVDGGRPLECKPLVVAANSAVGAGEDDDGDSTDAPGEDEFRLKSHMRQKRRQLMVQLFKGGKLGPGHDRRRTPSKSDWRRRNGGSSAASTTESGTGSEAPSAHTNDSQSCPAKAPLEDIPSHAGSCAGSATSAAHCVVSPQSGGLLKRKRARSEDGSLGTTSEEGDGDSEVLVAVDDTDSPPSSWPTRGRCLHGLPKPELLLLARQIEHRFL